MVVQVLRVVSCTFVSSTLCLYLDNALFRLTAPSTCSRMVLLPERRKDPRKKGLLEQKGNRKPPQTPTPKVMKSLGKRSFY